MSCPKALFAAIPQPEGSVDTLRKRVLVVDDDQDTVDATVQLLNYVGYQAIGTTSAQDAIKMAQAQPPAVVLLDLCMPGCNGSNLAQDLRQLPDMSHAIPDLRYRVHQRVFPRTIPQNGLRSL